MGLQHRGLGGMAQEFEMLVLFNQFPADACALGITMHAREWLRHDACWEYFSKQEVAPRQSAEFWLTRRLEEA